MLLYISLCRIIRNKALWKVNKALYLYQLCLFELLFKLQDVYCHCDEVFSLFVCIWAAVQQRPEMCKRVT